MKRGVILAINFVCQYRQFGVRSNYSVSVQNLEERQRAGGQFVTVSGLTGAFLFFSQNCVYVYRCLTSVYACYTAPM